jgi:hypothetical protein
VARLAAEFKRGLLRAIYAQGQATATPLAVAITNFQTQGFQAVGAGRQVTASAGAGKSVVFATPQIWMDVTQAELFQVAEEFQATYAQALTTLNIPAPTDASQDGVIFPEMLALLPTITSWGKDYSTLRWPTRL